MRHSRPDVSALGSTGGTDLFDVVITSPMTVRRVSNQPADPTFFLREEACKKHIRHRRLLEELGSGHKIVPFPLTIFGGRLKKTVRLLNTLSASAAARSLGRAAQTSKWLRSRIASAIVNGNADCLNAGMSTYL